MSIDAYREFAAESVEEARRAAATHFGVADDQLVVRSVPEEPAVSGLAGRALILAATEELLDKAPQQGRSSDRGDRGDRRETRGDRGDRGDRGGRREARGDRGERGRGDRGERGRGGRGRGREERGGGRRDKREAREPRDRDPDSGRGERRPEPTGPLSVETQGLGDVGEYVEDIVRAIAKNGSIRIEESRTGDEVLVTLSGDGADALARKEHGLPASISHLAHRAAERLVSNDASAYVEFERGDAPADERIERLVQEAAERVLESGNSEELDPMNSRDRFIVHTTVRDIHGVTSSSVGDGREKRVEIRPE